MTRHGRELKTNPEPKTTKAKLDERNNNRTRQERH